MKRALLLVSLVSLLVAAALAANGAAGTSKNVVVFGMTSDIDGGFNAAIGCCNTLPGAFMTVPVLRGAFMQNARGTWVKDLVKDAHADTHGVSYTIRPDAFWYWGGKKVPVTFRDFVYTLRELDDPANDVATRIGYANLDPTRFAHHGDRSVTFFWRSTGCAASQPCGPFANWPYLFSQLYPSFALGGQDFNTIWTNCICGSDGKPVSDGPFYLASRVPGQLEVMKRNPYFYDKAKLAEVDFKILSLDPGVLAEAMRDGQVDAIYPSFAPNFVSLRSTPGLTYEIAPGYGLEHVFLREGSARGGPSVTKGASNVLLRAPWMRQAIATALDRQGMIDAIYGPGSGLRPSNNLLFYPNQAGYRPDFARWSYDPAKALAILRRHCSGGPSAPDPATTKVWRCSGLPAVFSYAWPAPAAARTLIEQVARTDLEAVGIQIVDRPLLVPAIFQQVASGDYDLAQYADFTSGDPGDWFDAYRCQGAGNYTGYCSHTVDSLLRAASAELDPERRTLLFQRADAQMAAELPGIPLFQKPDTLIRKSALLGVGPNPGPSGPFWNIQDWHWKG
jgi:peptide/nickel transport system substrate-binding protein